ncbi:MAG: hypothetical protein IJY84_06025 [Clostridia bacterium]|nr:hypothetical protein [Clostridia bacterium]
MKKLLSTLLLTALFFALPCCTAPEQVDPRISQLRADVLYSDCQNFKICAYLESRENPLENDGVCGKVENFIIFKIDFGKSQTTFESCSVKFAVLDKEYCGDFEYKPLTSFLFAHVQVDALPAEPITVCISGKDLNETVTLYSIKNESTVSYNSVLDNLAQNNQTCKEFLEGDKGEIRIRLIDNDGYDYWYVGLFNGEKIISFLVDGETCEIIAQKDGF